MNETLETYKKYWIYFKEQEGYKVILRLIPFILVVFAILAGLTIYAFVSVGLGISELELASTINPNDAEAFISTVGINTLQALGTYILMISFVILLLSVGYSNTCYQSIKKHIINGTIPTLKETFTNALIGFFRYFGYLLLYFVIPTMAIVLLLYITGLQDYTFITVFLGAIIQYYFYSKLLRISGIDFLVPCVIGIVMIVISLLISNFTGVIGIVFSLVNSVVLGLIFNSVMIFSVLKINDFKEGIRIQ
jgi:hypothetical protein